MKTKDRIEGVGAFQEAQKRARFGHRRWVGYRTKDGVYVAERLTAEAMKRCLLSAGTKGHWTLIETDGSSNMGFWWLGCNLINQLKRGIA